MVATLLADRNRGQLLLIGAISIAFIILGIVVVFNSLLFTQTTSSGQTLETATDVNDTEREVRRGVARTLREKNRNSTAPTVKDDINDFNETFRRSKAQSRSAFATVDSASFGEDGRFLAGSRSGFSNHEVYNDTTSQRDLGEFVLWIEKSTLSGLMTVEFEPTTNNDDLEFDYNSITEVITVEEVSSGETCELDVDGVDTVRYDVLTGEANETSEGRVCRDVAKEIRGGSYNKITITGGGTASYEAAIKNDNSLDNADGSENRDDIVWDLTVNVKYYSDTISRDPSAITVEVYGENR